MAKVEVIVEEVPVEEVFVEEVIAGVVMVNIDNPKHGNLTYDEVQELVN